MEAVSLSAVTNSPGLVSERTPNREATSGMVFLGVVGQTIEPGRSGPAVSRWREGNRRVEPGGDERERQPRLPAQQQRAPGTPGPFAGWPPSPARRRRSTGRRCPAPAVAPVGRGLRGRDLSGSRSSLRWCCARWRNDEPTPRCRRQSLAVAGPDVGGDGDGTLPTELGGSLGGSTTFIRPSRGVSEPFRNGHMSPGWSPRAGQESRS